MFKRFRKIIIGIVILVIIGIGVSFALKKPSGPTYSTAKVTKMDLVQTVDATGSISSAEDIGMNFKATGRVAVVHVAVGDKVKQGQVLAELSADTLQSQVSSAQASVSSAQADLEKLLSGTTPEQLAVTQEEVSNAAIQLDSAKTNLQNLIASQQKTRDDNRSTALQALIDKKFVAQYALDVVFGDLLDQDASNLFKTTKTEAVLAARDSYTRARATLDSLDPLIQTAQVSQKNDDILTALNTLQTNLTQISACLQDSLDAYSGGIVTTSYSAAAIDGLKADSNAQATAVAAAKTAIQSSISNLTTGEDALQNAYDDANFAVKTAQGALDLAQAKLNLSTAKPQSYDIKQQQSRVAQAQASLQAALSNVADTVITAPIDGTITAVDIKVGEQALPTTPNITMIGTSAFEINVDIPESDIAKIAVGDAVSTTLDAFGPDVSFKGVVQSIEPAERLIEGVVYYRVTITFTEPTETLKSGMTANITITTATKPGVLVVPARAVTTTNEVKKVRVLTNPTTPVDREVTTGLKGDGGMLEITNGLTEGEVVVTGEQK